MLATDFGSPEHQSTFAQDDRARFANILQPDVATRLGSAFAAHTDYNWMLAPGGKPSEVPNTSMTSFSEPERQALQQKIWASAKRGQGFLYKGHRLETSPIGAFRDFYTALNSDEVLARIRTLTGNSDIVRADAQATRYEPGHFLTRHLDDPENETRLFAFVFSFCQNWHPDWGGLLQFYQRNGTPREAWAPGFNTLSLFSVRHVHAVTYVTPFAGQPRFSITGWFRGR